MVSPLSLVSRVCVVAKVHSVLKTTGIRKLSRGGEPGSAFGGCMLLCYR